MSKPLLATVGWLECISQTWSQLSRIREIQNLFVLMEFLYLFLFPDLVLVINFKASHFDRLCFFTTGRVNESQESDHLFYSYYLKSYLKF